MSEEALVEESDETAEAEAIAEEERTAAVASAATVEEATVEAVTGAAEEATAEHEVPATEATTAAEAVPAAKEKVAAEIAPAAEEATAEEVSREHVTPAPSEARDALLDIELEARIHFGSREMPLSALLELSAGDVLELDRLVSDPVDLLVGDRIVARGEVVLVGGNFGLQVTEVLAPELRLESVRCLP